jgi:site-specific recombinase XerD
VLGLTRARKLAAIREYFRFLVREHGLLHSPTEGIQTPKKERHLRTYLLPSEYNRLLSLAGANPRDYAILQVFLQTGVRLAELVGLTLDDVDFERRRLLVHGKGQAERAIELEKRGMQAIKNYLATRAQSLSDQLFLNYHGDPISTRGVQKILAKYQRLAGIARTITPHTLRHTFATYKAERGVPLRQVQEWLGHESIATTQIYVHLSRQNSQKVMEQTGL